MMDQTAKRDAGKPRSRRDAREGEIPVVMHRKTRSPWLVTTTLEDWIKFYREWECGDESAE